MGYRDETKVVQIGKRQIGGGNPDSDQSMQYENRGCERPSSRFWRCCTRAAILSVWQCRQ